MPFSPAAVANEFLRLAANNEQQITPLKMQKLVYFAHGWYLAITGQPLINEPIQAWKFGPVIQSLYKEFKDCGQGTIYHPATRMVVEQGFAAPRVAVLQDESANAVELEKARQVIATVWQQYGGLTASALSNITHLPGSPWDKVPNKNQPGIPIPNSWIKDHFIAEANRKRAVAAF